MSKPPDDFAQFLEAQRADYRRGVQVPGDFAGDEEDLTHALAAARRPAATSACARCR